MSAALTPISPVSLVKFLLYCIGSLDYRLNVKVQRCREETRVIVDSTTVATPQPTIVARRKCGLWKKLVVFCSYLPFPQYLFLVRRQSLFKILAVTKRSHSDGLAFKLKTFLSTFRMVKITISSSDLLHLILIHRFNPLDLFGLALQDDSQNEQFNRRILHGIHIFR